MKAKQIKKLRQVVVLMQSYVVESSSALFGEFSWNGKNGTTIMASSPRHAIQRYLKRYERKHKERHRFHACTDDETTRNWGRFMVITPSGYKSFFR